MANINARNFTRPKSMRCDGTAVFITDVADITANPTACDTVSFTLPAGLELHKLWIHPTDMDTSTGLAGSVGWAANSQFTVNATGFRAAAALGQAAGAVDISPAVPIKLEYDLVVTITWSVTATAFAAGTVALIANGNAVGPQ